MFRVGDKIVHPMHGAGIVESIVENKIDGVIREYYVMRLPVRAMVVMIPTHNCGEIGVRPIADRKQAQQILAGLTEIQAEVEQNWNRRYRENMERLKSGNLLEVAKVIKSLMLRDTERGLSNGERKMLHSAKEILISELVLALEEPFERIEDQVTATLSK
ncbi:MAG: CarD family transcriptional regulator [Oscillospiraceae bacterium]|nr:CarD family transcriptional regulator [Oscillospiraceae bacterium]